MPCVPCNQLASPLTLVVINYIGQIKSAALPRPSLSTLKEHPLLSLEHLRSSGPYKSGMAFPAQPRSPAEIPSQARAQLREPSSSRA